jgi:hypothetical protein
MHHKWVRQFNADGEDYLHCTVCGKDRYDVERHDPDIGSGMAPWAAPDHSTKTALAFGRAGQQTGDEADLLSGLPQHGMA